MPSNRIRVIREERARMVPAAFTVSAVARRVGVTEAALRRWENGSARPRQRHARSLARELGVSVEALGLELDGDDGGPAEDSDADLVPS